ncbi:probable G-protein coupled receptor 101 [Physella acuta]|uniref:probable G-protein coupled receptor 101 n=1 Tax=Physella acuta TaxID=109671 RepID=UPI0027DDAD30|nr:probable G-protein coupled receptor 101 [Physella acuta]
MATTRIFRNTTAVEGIDDVNDAMVSRLTPALVFIAVLIATGIVGNLLVLYIFVYRLKLSTQNFFIVCLAVFDVIGCVVSMPGEIVDMVLYYKFQYVIVCKSLRFVVVFSSLCSSITLVCIAVDRFRKVCKPSKRQMTIRHARLCLLPIIVGSLLFSFPAPILYGISTIETGIPGLTGNDCTFSDDVKDTAIPLIYNMFLFVGFLSEIVVLVILYALMLKTLRRHRKYMKQCNFNMVLFHEESKGENRKRKKPRAVLLSSASLCAKWVLADKTTHIKTECSILNEGEKRERGLTGVANEVNEMNVEMTKAGLDFGSRDKESRSRAVEDSRDVEEITLRESLAESNAKIFGASLSNISVNSLNLALNSAFGELDDIAQNRISTTMLIPPSSPGNGIFSISSPKLACSPKKKNKNKRQAQTNQPGFKNNITTKTTLIAFVVTLAFIVSYLPHLSFQVAKLVHSIDDRNGPLVVLYNIIVRSIFLNAVVNPVIYGVLNLQFRQEVKNLARKLCCRGKGCNSR